MTTFIKQSSEVIEEMHINTCRVSELKKTDINVYKSEQNFN